MARIKARGRGTNGKSKEVVPLPKTALDEREDADVLSDEDFEFVASHAKSLGFLTKMKSKQLDASVSQARDKKVAKGPAVPRTFEAAGLRRGADDEESSGSSGAEEVDSEDEEADYEREHRRDRAGEWQAKEEQRVRRRETALPTKGLDGQLVLTARPAPEGVKVIVPGVTIEEDDHEPMEAADEGHGEEAAEEEEDAEEEEEQVEDVASAALAAIAGLPPAQQVQAARERMALAAQAVLAEPERQLAQLADLVELAQPGAFVPGVTRLALLSCAAVFADIVPGYRIHTVAEEEGSAQMLSKEVRELRRFEQGLLRQYQRYLRAALHELTGGARDPAGARVAARCLCRSLLAAPHFNYTTDILQAIVPVVAARDPALRAAALGALGDLVAGTSADGAVVTEAIQLLADVVKRRDCVCPREVVGVLARLTTADIASLKDLRDAQKNRKKSKKKKHRRDEVDAAFAESQAVTDAEARRHQQATSLEAVFEIYFRVLKHATASGLFAETEGKPLSADRFAKRFPLLFPVLEQLARHAHLIGIEYFGDLMAVFDKLLASSALPAAERVRTLLTVASILGGQGDALNVDRGAFYLHLYRALDLVCLQEPEEDEEDGAEWAAGDGKARAAAPGSATAETPRSAPPRVGPLLVQLCERMLTDRKALDSARQAAFAKRLAATAAAARDPGLALGLLTLLNRLLRLNVRLAAMLHNESGGPAGFRTLQLDARDPAEAGALATPLWELALLSRHWHPTVSQVAAEVAQGAAQAGLAALPPAAGPAEVAERCSTDRGGFRPAPPAPKAATHKRARGAAAPEDVAVVETRLAAPPAPWTESFLARVAGRQGEGLSKRARKKQRREAAAADSAETLAAHEEESEGAAVALDEAALQAAFRAFFRASRRFEEHQRLLLQKHRLLAQLQAFERRRREHAGKK